MVDSVFQYIDIQSREVVYYQIENDVVSVLKKWDSDGTDDFVLSAINQLKLSFTSVIKNPPILILPAECFEYKVIRCPVGMRHQDLGVLIDYEFRETVDLGARLDWRAIRLFRDSVEDVYFVSVLKNKIDICLNGDIRITDSPFCAVSRLFLCLQQFLGMETLQCDFDVIFYIEDGDCKLFSCLDSQVWFRQFKVDADLVQSNETLILCESEIKRCIARIKREGLGRSLTHLMIAEIGSAFVFMKLQDGYSDKTNVVELNFLDPLWVKGQLDSEHLASLDLDSVNQSNHLIGKKVHPYVWCGLLFFALTPHMFAYSNRCMIHLLQQRIEHGRVILEGRNHDLSSLREKETEYANLEGRLRSWIDVHQNQHFWIRLMSDIQDAMISVQDVWIDDMGILLNPLQIDEESCMIRGRFLIRKNHLEESMRLEVVQGAEQHLKKLNTYLLQSELIEEIRDWKVDFRGLDQGIHVVLFQMSFKIDTHSFFYDVEPGGFFETD